jgi:hypothetical protein
MASATEAAVAATPDTVRWGTLPSRGDEALAEVRAGDRIVIDTVSHEGILEDQGRDPVAFFAAQGSSGVTYCPMPSTSPARCRTGSASTGRTS